MFLHKAQGKSISFRDIIGIDALKQVEFTVVHHLHHRIVAHQHTICNLFPLCARIPENSKHQRPGVQDDVRPDVGSDIPVVDALVLPETWNTVGYDHGASCLVTSLCIFALGATDTVVWMLIGGILLHGACYDFVYVASQVYIDKRATAEIRAQAQGIFCSGVLRIGQGLGALTSGWIYNSIMHGSDNPTLEQWQSFWMVPLVFSVVVTILFALGFRDSK